MHFALVTLFPEMFQAITEYGVTGRAIRRGLVDVSFVNPRDFTQDKHRTVDDRPYGGGPGMLMLAEPLSKAIQAAKSQVGNDAHVVYLSPQGRPASQQVIEELKQRQNLVFVAGRYEGVDERVIQREVDEEVSLADFVLSGGEIAAMALMDGIIRLEPDVLGHKDSAVEDSFAEGLLDHPHYTRPEVFEGESVPEVLMSGNHELIRRWRLKQSLGRTWLRRPDMLSQLELTEEQQRLLDEFQREQN
ncbi:tRNA (guanosine(37)-N1)-methyltransferase TrmD [Pleionea sp. CnH1-48]|uniref:tRNA (guanosine(37)-N1)-methyltransferase TrmD n=1 Tax=Pleionea sp. CnH1-48 TaxID=2954494 RepID=UPI0020986462|nr:tRNA (guanosine(37)-N1)-methyltransferase TrmD [Pleionea sp. CnH1-48]